MPCVVCGKTQKRLARTRRRFDPSLIVNGSERLPWSNPPVRLGTVERPLSALAAVNRAIGERSEFCQKPAFDDNSFDNALAINSMQYWPKAVAGLTLGP